MNISYKWLQSFITEDLPDPDAVADVLTHGAYEVEGIESVEDDVIIDIDVLPNRASDSLSHEGVARELAVLLDLTFTPIDPQPETSTDTKSADQISLSIDADTCRRALKRLVVDVEIGESPDWLKSRLAALGQRSINNVVDITNYVMFEIGQPVHAFDYDKLSGSEPKEVFIRSAEEDEEITTLDGDTFALAPDMIVIADNEKALDIAGVKGGQASGIDEKTMRVMLSVCSFDAATIRKTSQQLNLRTQACKRFENDVPPARSRRAMDRFSELIQQVTNASVADDVCDVYPNPKNAYKVGVTTSQINNLLGSSIATNEAVDILERLGCDVELVLPRTFVQEQAPNYVDVPYSYGASVLKDAPEAFDCSSFTSWLYVQAGVALPRTSGDQWVYTDEITKDELQPGDLVFSNTEKDKGGTIYYETLEFMPGTEIPGGVDHCEIYLGDGKVIHASRHNGESGGVRIEDLDTSEQFKNITKYGRVPEADQERLVVTIPDWRTDLRYSHDLIEEVGRVYGYDNIEAVMPPDVPATKKVNVLGRIRDELVSLGFSEVKTYSLVESGDIKLANPVAEDKAYLRATMRDNLAAVLESNQTHKPVLAADTLRVFEVDKIFTKEAESFAVGIATDGDEQDVVAAFEHVSTLLGIELAPEINDGVGMAILPDLDTIDVDATTKGSDKEFAAVKFRTPSTYPYVLRDVAVWTPAGTEKEAVADIVADAAGDLLVTTNHFDTYEKEDQISYAFKLVFQSDERTLSDEEVNEHMQAVEEALEGNKGFSVR